jgi:hypothetical protein
MIKQKKTSAHGRMLQKNANRFDYALALSFSLMNSTTKGVATNKEE